MQSVLPPAISVVLHALILIVGFAAVRHVTRVVQVIKDRIIIPDITLVQSGAAGGIPNPGLGGDPMRAAAQNQAHDIPASASWSQQAGRNLDSNFMRGGGEETMPDSLIGLGSQVAFGKGDLAASGSGNSGGVLAEFGVPGGGGGIGLKSDFIGIGGNAQTVIFICDASGSMINLFDQLKSELEKSIKVLQPIQGFNVIFFRDQDAEAINKYSLLMANQTNKTKASKFLQNISVSSGTQPIPALEMAFRQKPELIYLLTDGDFSDPSNEEVLARINQLNRDKKTRINTILFTGTRDDKDILRPFMDVMTQIASENGGVFKYVSSDEL